MAENTQQRRRRIYSTQIIDQMIKDDAMGYDIDYAPFFEKDTSLRASNIPFQMTEEEMQEYQKCYDEPLYFVEKWCKFMTDNGLATVPLRDYQKDIIATVTAEHYVEELDNCVPDNKNIIIMASRQTGKCVSPCTNLDISYDKETCDSFATYDTGYFERGVFGFIKRPIYMLYGKFHRGVIKEFLGRIIQGIEKLQYMGYDFDENDINKKIVKEIDPYENLDLWLRGAVSYNKIKKSYITQPYRVCSLELVDGKYLEAADMHILFDENMNQVLLKDLKPGDQVMTESGPVHVKNMYMFNHKITMRDFELDNDHTYYTNGILSHNTTTISAFLAWMLVFHIDRNILVVANKEDTAKEIVDKVMNIFKGLPFFLKPGTESWGKTALKLDNGSRILSSATTNTASIGFTIHCVLLDEFAHIPDNIVNNFWRSVYPTITSSKVSQCIITSTPNGTTNKFYDIWTNNKNSFAKMRVDYWQVPGHDEAWAEQMKVDFGEEEFAQEFELQFNKNSKTLLKTNDIEMFTRLSTDYVHKQIYINNQYLNTEDLTWDPRFDPNDINENDIFVMLVDISEGGGDPDADKNNKKKDRSPDYNSINIFKVVLNSPANLKRFSYKSCKLEDCVRFVQVGKFHNNTEDEIYAAKVASALTFNLFKAHERNNVKLMIEMNFNGKSFYEEFRRHPLFSAATVLRTYHKKPLPGESCKKKPGFKTTSNKELYCVRGNSMISRKRIIVTCTETIEQMKSFGYVRGKLKGIGVHDDLSMPVFNHISRMIDESSFIAWIDEWMTIYADKTKVYMLNQIIQRWAMDNPDMSDDDFGSLYGVDDGGGTFGTQVESPFGEDYGFDNNIDGFGGGGFNSYY